MNSKGHLFISLGKSAIRVIGGIVTLVNGSIIPLMRDSLRRNSFLRRLEVIKWY